MTTIIDFRKFRDRGRAVPTLVLMDLHHEQFDLVEVNCDSGPTAALETCGLVLAHARACGFPVAFTRRIPVPDNLAAVPAYPRWINGFEPQRADMVFDHCRPSCYASPEFAEMAEHIGGNFVMAGRVGELSCLATAVDAFHRDQRPTVLTDAVVSRGGPGLSSATVERVLAHILSLYVEADCAQAWMAATSRRQKVRE
jgi:nicotinamidase-related amidase